MAGKTKYKNQFAKEKYDRVGLMLPKGMKTELLKHISETGDKSLNAFIIKAIQSQLQPNKDNKEYATITYHFAEANKIGGVEYSPEYKKLIERQYDGEDVSEELENFDDDKIYVDASTGKEVSFDTVSTLAYELSRCLETSRFLIEDIFYEFCPELTGNLPLLEEFDENFENAESYVKNCM